MDAPMVAFPMNAFICVPAFMTNLLNLKRVGIVRIPEISIELIKQMDNFF